MKLRPSVLAVAVLLGLVLPLAARDTISPVEQIQEMAFLTGHWKGPMGDKEFHAYYTTPEGGKVMSFSQLMSGDTVAFHEFEVFEPQGDTVVFRPFPGGRPATLLTLTALVKNKATFENPDKDFPTRIEYSRIEKDRLVITLSDPHGKSDKIQKFDLKRNTGVK